MGSEFTEAYLHWLFRNAYLLEIFQCRKTFDTFESHSSGAGALDFYLAFTVHSP